MMPHSENNVEASMGCTDLNRQLWNFCTKTLDDAQQLLS